MFGPTVRQAHKWFRYADKVQREAQREAAQFARWAEELRQVPIPPPAMNSAQAGDILAGAIVGAPAVWDE